MPITGRYPERLMLKQYTAELTFSSTAKQKFDISVGACAA